MLNLYRKEEVTCRQPCFEGPWATGPSGKLLRDRESVYNPGPAEGSACTPPTHRHLGVQKRRTWLATDEVYPPTENRQRGPRHEPDSATTAFWLRNHKHELIAFWASVFTSRHVSSSLCGPVFPACSHLIGLRLSSEISTQEPRSSA